MVVISSSGTIVINVSSVKKAFLTSSLQAGECDAEMRALASAPASVSTSVPVSAGGVVSLSVCAHALVARKSERTVDASSFLCMMYAS